jgi:hypothetical protein
MATLAPSGTSVPWMSRMFCTVIVVYAGAPGATSSVVSEAETSAECAR